MLPLNPRHLDLVQRLSNYSFQIPQDPISIRSCYDPNVVIITNGESSTLDEFIEYMTESNTLNVTQIYGLEVNYTPNESDPSQIVWTVTLSQQRFGRGLNEIGEGIYFIKQRAILSFEDNLIIRQENTPTKIKVSE